MFKQKSFSISESTQKQLWIGLGIVIILVLAVVWMGRSPARQPTTGEPIKIGAVLSLTGPAAYHGSNIQKGINLALKEINGAGGIQGKKLEVILEDDQTQPKETVSAVQKLINADRVSVIIGPTWDFLSNAAVPVAAAAGVALVSPATLPDTLHEQNRESPYFFSTHAPVSTSKEAVKKFLAKEKVKHAAIIAVHNDWGAAYANMFVAAVKESGGTVTKLVRLPQVDNNDLRTDLTIIKKSPAQAVLLAMNFNDDANFVMRYRELGLTQKVLGNENFGVPFRQGKTSFKDGADFYEFEFSKPDASFTERFQTTYNEIPGIYADTGYDAAYVIKQAIERSGTESKAIARGLKTIKDYQGAAGLIDYTVNNYPINKSVMLKKITENGFVEVR